MGNQFLNSRFDQTFVSCRGKSVELCSWFSGNPKDSRSSLDGTNMIFVLPWLRAKRLLTVFKLVLNSARTAKISSRKRDLSLLARFLFCSDSFSQRVVQFLGWRTTKLVSFINGSTVLRHLRVLLQQTGTLHPTGPVPC